MGRLVASKILSPIVAFFDLQNKYNEVEHQKIEIP